MNGTGKHTLHAIRGLATLLAALILGTAAAASGPPRAAGPARYHHMLAEAKARAFLGKTRILEPKPTQESFDVLHYGLDLSVDPASESLAGNVSIHLRSATASLDSVVLDLTSRSQMRVDSVHVDGVLATYTWMDDALGVALAEGLSEGEEVYIRVWYGGEPETGREGFRFRETPRGGPIIWTLSEPQMARGWWPCKDVPADKATADISVRVPESLTAVSNGTLVDIITHLDGTRTWVWQELYPIATYLVSLAICEYEHFEDRYVSASGDTMPVAFYVYPEHLMRAQEDFEYTVDMIEFYASVFGEYPFLDEKYGMAEVPWGGAMEHQTITSYGDGLITGTHTYDRIIAHELAHQWWGDSVTLETWDDIWLNEGFAVYSEALWADHTGGETAYFDYMRDIDLENGFVGSLYAPSADPDSAFQIPYVFTVYDKGAWVLHMLRHVLGDSTFFDMLRAYGSSASHAYKTANTAQFQSFVENECGRDLTWFFDEWIYGSGRPEYDYVWETSAVPGGHRLSLQIDQVQDAESVFRMPLDILVRTLSGETSFVAVDSLRCQEFSFMLDDYPLDVVLDEDGWVLKRVQERRRPVALHRGFPNPFGNQTSVVFDVPQDGHVDLSVYDVTGRLVKRLVDIWMPATRHSVVWSGVNDQGNRVAPGVYFCRLKVGTRSEVVRLVALR